MKKMLLIILTIMILPMVARATTAEITGTSTSFDSYMYHASAGSNYGTSNELDLGNWSTGEEAHAWIKFDLTGISGTVTAAACSLYMSYHTGAEGTEYVKVNRCLKPATEGAISWTNYTTATAWTTAGGDWKYPSSDSSLVTNFGGDGTWKVFTNLATLFQFWVDHPDSNFGMIIWITGSGSCGLTFNSSEATSDKPIAFVTYNSTPSCTAPTNSLSWLSAGGYSRTQQASIRNNYAGSCDSFHVYWGLRAAYADSVDFGEITTNLAAPCVTVVTGLPSADSIWITVVSKYHNGATICQDSDYVVATTCPAAPSAATVTAQHINYSGNADSIRFAISATGDTLDYCWDTAYHDSSYTTHRDHKNGPSGVNTVYGVYTGTEPWACDLSCWVVSHIYGYSERYEATATVMPPLVQRWAWRKPPPPQ